MNGSLRLWVERAVREKDQVGAAVRVVVEELEELASTTDGAQRCADPVAVRQATFCEHGPLGRPLLGDAGGDHHDHRSTFAGGADRRHSDRQRDECLAHSDLVGEHQAGLVVESAEDLFGGVLLSIGVLVWDPVVPETHAGVRVPLHRSTSSKASPT